MNAFTFPKPGEHTNTASVVLPERNLAALYALALVGKERLTVGGDCFVTPQCQDALREVLVLLSEELSEVAYHTSVEMCADLDAEYPSR